MNSPTSGLDSQQTSIMERISKSIGISVAHASSDSSSSRKAPFDSSLSPGTPALGPIPDDEPESWFNSAMRIFSDYPPLPEASRFDEISIESREINTLDIFDGAKFTWGKSPLGDTPNPTKMFMYRHSLWLGSEMITDKCHYDFETFYASQSGLQLVGSTDMHGNVSGRCLKQFASFGIPQLTTKLQFSIPTEGAEPSLMLESDFMGSDWNTQAKLLPGGILQVQYMQSISKSLSTGCDFIYPPGRMSILGAALRFSDNRNFATATVHSNGLAQFSFAKKINPQFSMASDLKVDSVNHETAWNIGLMYQPSQNSIVKAMVDGTGRVASTYDEIIMDTFRLTFSSELDHAKSDYKFGFGIQS